MGTDALVIAVGFFNRISFFFQQLDGAGNLFQLNIVYFTANLALEMGMHGSVSIETGIPFVNCQHLGCSMFHKQLQCVVYSGFREGRNLGAESHVDFVDARMGSMLQQVIHDGYPLDGRLDAVT